MCLPKRQAGILGGYLRLGTCQGRVERVHGPDLNWCHPQLLFTKETHAGDLITDVSAFHPN